jgi:hypothetical protein
MRLLPHKSHEDVQINVMTVLKGLLKTISNSVSRQSRNYEKYA